MIPPMDFSRMTGNGEFDVRLIEASVADGNVSLYELLVINSLVRLKKPATIFEIGTFNGRTALNMSANSDAGTVIFTLDLPAQDLEKTQFALDEIERKFVSKPASGTKFTGRPEAKKITQLYGDSAKFDFSKFENTIDLVFVDASHAYEYVLNDSKIALRLLRKGKGVILWHDYNRGVWWPGVTRALDELYQSARDFSKLTHFEGTSLACLIKD